MPPKQTMQQPMPPAKKTAKWHNHINHVQTPEALRHWLVEAGSLTAKLIAHSQTFRVQRLFQQPAHCWADEYAKIGLSRINKVYTRDVLLRCDDVAAVYAHTVLPLDSTAGQWPLFNSLGNKSLGSILFSDPQVKRGALQFARLHPGHPAMLNAQRVTQNEAGFKESNQFSRPLFARRSLFFRRGGMMLVTELFLPPLLSLREKT